MKKIVLIFSFIFTISFSYSQSDNCATPTSISPNSTCVSTTGTTAGATQSFPGCVGNATADVWYQFTANATSHQITVTASVGFDPVVQLFSGGCTGLTTLSCMDNGLTGENETIYATGLTAGQVYRIRVYHYYASAPATPTFSICVTNPLPVPINDDCSAATLLNVNTSCSPTAGTTVGATQSMVGCAGNADDDVWYRFVATNAVQTITVDPSTTMDAVVELFSGTCSDLTSIICKEDGFNDGNEVIEAVGLTVGMTYYIRVYDYYASTGGTPFTICVSGQPTPAPTNDEPCNALQWPSVTSACNYLSFTTIGATTTTVPGTPSSTCQNWNGGSNSYGTPSSGGFGVGTKDVWFKVNVPSTGNLTFTIKPGLASPTNDMVFVLYSGTCASLSQIACSDDYNYPGSANDLQPFINQTGLVPGTDVYLRVYCYGTTNSGNFALCISTNTNDNCSNALYICDLNGYSGSTSAAFTPDRPGTGTGQMLGNNETPDGTDQMNGVNTGGVFGYYPPSNIAGPYSSPAIDVTINNNSWIRFTASATTAVLNINIGDCFANPYPAGGIQMQIFASNLCDNFSPVSQFNENSTGFTISASGLTIGSDYYLMVDGYANDICNYTISANSGVLFPEIISNSSSVCSGESVLLSAPNGATSYEWYPGGETTQAISVSPSSTTTYSCVVDPICSQRITLTKTITVYQPPVMTSSTTPAPICSGSSVGLVFSSNVASNYTWYATDNSNVIGESLTSQNGNVLTNTLTSGSTNVETINYFVTPTSVSGNCVGTAQTVAVTVKPIPTLDSINSQFVCSGNSISSINYVVQPLGAIVNWTNSNTNIGIQLNGNGDINSIIAPSVLANEVGIITAEPYLNGCIGVAQSFSITINALPTITTPTISDALCNTATGSITNISGIGASPFTYSWDSGLPSASAELVNVVGNNYSLLVSDSNNCSSAFVFLIPNNNNLIPPILDSLVEYCKNEISLPLNSIPQSGGNINWYSDNTGTILLTDLIPNTDSIGSTTFYAAETLNSCVSALDSTVVTIKPNNGIVGVISASGTVANALVYLLTPSVSLTSFDTVSVVNVNTSGQYSFPNINPGYYWIKCIPDSIFYPSLMNTYYGDTTSWENAWIIVNDCDNEFEANINLLEASQNSGSGYASGFVFEGPGYTNRMGQMPNTSLAVGDPIMNLDVNLINLADGRTMDQSTTDSLGFFEFSNIAVGNYTLQVDVPGFIMDSTYNFTIDPLAFLPQGSNQVSSSIFTNLDFKVDDNSIYPINFLTHLQSRSNIGDGVIIYPNPTSSNLNVKILTSTNDQGLCRVFNNLGAMVYEQKINGGNTKLNLEFLNNGVYYLSLIMQDKNLYLPFVKKD